MDRTKSAILTIKKNWKFMLLLIIFASFGDTIIAYKVFPEVMAVREVKLWFFYLMQSGIEILLFLTGYYIALRDMEKENCEDEN